MGWFQWAETKSIKNPGKKTQTVQWSLLKDHQVKGRKKNQVEQDLSANWELHKLPIVNFKNIFVIFKKTLLNQNSKVSFFWIALLH